MKKATRYTAIALAVAAVTGFSAVKLWPTVEPGVKLSSNSRELSPMDFTPKEPVQQASEAVATPPMPATKPLAGETPGQAVIRLKNSTNPKDWVSAAEALYRCDFAMRTAVARAQDPPLPPRKDGRVRRTPSEKDCVGISSNPGLLTEQVPLAVKAAKTGDPMAFVMFTMIKDASPDPKDPQLVALQNELIQFGISKAVPTVLFGQSVWYEHKGDHATALTYWHAYRQQAHLLPNGDQYEDTTTGRLVARIGNEQKAQQAIEAGNQLVANARGTR